MSLLTDSDWAAFYNLMDEAHQDFAQKDLIWNRSVEAPDRWGEDTNHPPEVIVLKVLANYNYYRSWPITQSTETGDLDKQSVQVLLNKRYLAANGFLNADGYLNYDAGTDTFEMDGLIYQPAGDTPASQAKNDDIWITLILRRDELTTGG